MGRWSLEFGQLACCAPVGWLRNMVGGLVWAVLVVICGGFILGFDGYLVVVVFCGFCSGFVWFGVFQALDFACEWWFVVVYGWCFLVV